MGQREQTRVEPGGAWTQTMQGFTNAAVEIVGQTMHLQQDLVRMWVDTQQQLAGFWIRPRDETNRTGSRGTRPGQRGGARSDR